MSTTMHINGVTQTVNRLRELPAKVSKKIVRKGLRSGAKIIQTGAKAEAPDRSGVTKKNIKVRAGRSRNGRIAMTVGIGKKYFTGPAFYASFVLFGHRVGSRKLGNARKQVPANNFLERAYEENKTAAVDKITETIITGVESAAGGAA